MRCRLTSLFLVLLTSLLISAGVNKAVCGQAHIGLVEIAEEAIRAQGQAQVTDEVSTILSGPNSDSYRDLLLAKIDAATASRQKTYTDYNATFEVREVRLTRHGATVRLLERGALTLANSENDPGVPVAEEYEHEHVVRLVREEQAWKVVNDRILNLPRSATPIPSLREHSLPQPTSPLFFKDSAPGLSINAQSLSFSRSAAASYALQYWSSYNPNYRSFPGVDCTNFASQAVRAGGWTDVTGQSGTNTNWWYNAFNQSTTWVNAHAWAIFTYNRPRATMAAYVSDLRVGDILQADWTGDGTIDHTMIVTYKSGSEIYLTYHSNNQKNKPFSTISADNQNALWYGYLLSSSFN